MCLLERDLSLFFGLVVCGCDMIIKLRFVAFFVIILLAACQAESDTLPTFVNFPSETMTPSVQDTATASPSQARIVVSTTDTAIATFTDVPDSSPTNTVSASATITTSPTSITRNCSQIAYVYHTEHRVNLTYTNRLQTLLEETDLSQSSIIIMDDAWEAAYCEDTRTSEALFRRCYEIVATIEMSDETIHNQALRIAHLETILQTINHPDFLCYPEEIEITFRSSVATIKWQSSDLRSLRQAYLNGEEGLMLYLQGYETVFQD